MLGTAVGISGAGFFAAAVLSPWAVERLGQGGWMVVCAGTAAVLAPALGLPFAPVPILIAAFVLGLVTQGTKIATDTVVQLAVDDAYRGRVFSLYDVLYNVGFVGAVSISALMLPSDGRSVPWSFWSPPSTRASPPCCCVGGAPDLCYGVHASI